MGGACVPKNGCQAGLQKPRTKVIGLDIGVTESVSGRPAKTKILLLSLDPCL